MNHWIFVLFLLVGHVGTLRAEPFNQAEVTKTINLVSLLPQDTRAVPGDLVKGNTALQTGGNSRAELQFPDLTITRVGSNALFRFIAGTREIVLDGGNMLFSSPEGVGGGKVQAGAITAAVTGSDFLISNAGRVKVICLSHKVLVYFTANPKIRAVLLPGQMLHVAPGDKKMPPVVTINLETLLATSKLGEAGGFGPFPNQTILAYNVSKQGRGFVPAKGPLPANVNLTAQTAQTVRSTEVANNNPPSQFAAQAARNVPSTTAARNVPSTTAANNNPASQSTAAPVATGSPSDTTSSGTGGSRGNNSNIRNIENRGNSGSRGNNSNIRNIENRGNSGNAPGRAGR